MAVGALFAASCPTQHVIESPLADKRGQPKAVTQRLSGSSGKNLVLSQVSCNPPDRITWHGVDAKKSEATWADEPLSTMEQSG